MSGYVLSPLQFREHLSLRTVGVNQPSADLPLSRHGGQPRTASVLVLFLPSIQLLGSRAPAPHAEGK
jgi:hypothetical protein